MTKLLPGKTGSSVLRREFKYLPIGIKNPTRNEYEAEISTYVMIACDYLSNKTEQIVDIIESIPYVSDADAGLIKNKILSLDNDIEGKGKIYNSLQKSVECDSDYSEVKKKVLIELLQFYNICDGYGESLSNFSYKNFLNRNKIDSQTVIDTISKIFKSGGMDELVKLAESVEDGDYFSEIVYQSVDTETYYSLTDAMNNEENKAIRRFLLYKMTDADLIAYQERFKESDRIGILTTHALSDAIVSYVKGLSADLEKEYWQKASFYGCNTLTNDNYDYAVTQTINQKNYDTAVQMVWMKTEEGPYNLEQIYHVLECYELPKEELGRNALNYIKFNIQQLISVLQEKEENNIDRLVNIEKKYICFLSNREFLHSKYLYYKMANDPTYTYSILIEQRQNMVADMYDSSITQLLCNFNICPGGQPDDELDYQKMKAWYEFAEKADDENLRREMLDLFGKTMFYLPEKSEGFFLDERYAEFLESVANKDVLRAYESEAINSKGCIDRNPGSHELDDLISNYNNKATACEREGFIRIAEMYRTIADTWSVFLDME